MAVSVVELEDGLDDEEVPLSEAKKVVVGSGLPQLMKHPLLEAPARSVLKPETDVPVAGRLPGTAVDVDAGLGAGM